MEKPIHLAAWKTIGENHIPMVFSEWFAAMQQNAVDGQENPFKDIINKAMEEVTEYQLKLSACITFVWYKWKGTAMWYKLS